MEGWPLWLSSSREPWRGFSTIWALCLSRSSWQHPLAMAHGTLDLLLTGGLISSPSTRMSLP